MIDYKDTFEFKVTGVGWAEMIFTNFKGEVGNVRLSYVDDPLPEFIDALCGILSDERMYQYIDIRGENEWHGIILSVMPDTTLRIEVMKDAYFSSYEPEDGVLHLPVFTGFYTMGYFCEVVIEKLQHLVKLMSIELYKDIWCWDFPVEQLHRLAEVYKGKRSW